jgi:hypothetical protein
VNTVTGRSGYVYGIAVVPVARLNVQVTGYAVYEEPATMAVSESRKVIGDVEQSEIVAVQTNVHGAGVRKSVGSSAFQVYEQVAETTVIPPKIKRRCMGVKYIANIGSEI